MIGAFLSKETLTEISVCWTTKGREMSGACDCPAVSTHNQGALEVRWTSGREVSGPRRINSSLTQKTRKELARVASVFFLRLVCKTNSQWWS